MVSYFLIPLYNESANIQELHDNLTAVLPGVDKFFVLVDDCSTDDTIQQIHSYFKDTSYHVIEKPLNQGPGDSFNLGFEWILANSLPGAELIVTIEGDNTSDLTTLPKMHAIANLGFDLVLASVYAQGGKLEKTGLFRKIVSLGANVVLRSVFNLRVATMSSFYRIYRISLVQTIKNNHSEIIREKGFICMVEILIKAIKSGASVIEVPTNLLSHKRKGRSKMKILRTFKEYLRFLIMK